MVLSVSTTLMTVAAIFATIMQHVSMPSQPFSACVCQDIQVGQSLQLLYPSDEIILFRQS